MLAPHKSVLFFVQPLRLLRVSLHALKFFTAVLLFLLQTYVDALMSTDTVMLKEESKTNKNKK